MILSLYYRGIHSSIEFAQRTSSIEFAQRTSSIEFAQRTSSIEFAQRTSSMEFTVQCREIGNAAQSQTLLNVRETFVVDTDAATIVLFRKFIGDRKDDSIGSIICELRNSHLREFRDAAQKISRFVNESKDLGVNFITYIE